jgi:hypothetical protein
MEKVRATLGQLALLGLLSVASISPTRAQTGDFMKGFGAMKGLMDQVQKTTGNSQGALQQQAVKQLPLSDNGPAKEKAPEASGLPTNADEFCSAIKASPLVSEYVKALSKAVRTKTTDDDAVFTATVRQFDNEQGQLKKWVSNTPIPNGDKDYAYRDRMRRKASTWAALCAAKNNDNDLFLFFFSDLRESDRITAMRARAKAALKNYESVGPETKMTKLDANGDPVYETAVKESKFAFELPSPGILEETWLAFLLPNGQTALNSTGKGKAEELSAKVDQALKVRDQAATQAAVERREKEKSHPNDLLYQAYQAIQLVQTCYDVRQGYAAIYVTNTELGDAKEKMRKIEAILEPKIIDESADQIWNRAAAGNANYIRGVKTASYTNGKNYCALFKRDMEEVSEKVIGKELPQRRF